MTSREEFVAHIAEIERKRRVAHRWAIAAIVLASLSLVLGIIRLVFL